MQANEAISGQQDKTPTEIVFISLFESMGLLFQLPKISDVASLGEQVIELARGLLTGGGGGWPMFMARRRARALFFSFGVFLWRLPVLLFSAAMSNLFFHFRLALLDPALMTAGSIKMRDRLRDLRRRFRVMRRKADLFGIHHNLAGRAPDRGAA